MNSEQTSYKGLLPKHFSWLTIILAILTIVTFFSIYNSQGYYNIMPTSIVGTAVMDYDTRVSVPPTAGMPEMQGGSVSVSSKGADMMYYPYPNPEVPVTDTREFLKIYYSANMRTRDVQGLTNRVETTVRGYDGRVDNQSISSKYGSVSFAMPQSKFAAFRAELESLVGKRFLTINISSQNLLSQKVSIEEQQKQADTSLATYKAERQKIVNNHTSSIATLQSKIDKANQDLLSLRAQTESPQILAQIAAVSNDLAYQRKLLDNENTNYKNQLSSADSNIKYAQDWQKAVETQDKTLLENVATVTGTVSIQWMSLWDCVRTYLPGYSIPILLSVLTLISFLYDRKRYGLA